jgi:hypothetical protein
VYYCMVSREIFRDIRVMLTTYRGRVDPWKRHESDSSGIGTEYWDGWDIKERKGKEHSDGVLDFALLDFAFSSLGHISLRCFAEKTQTKDFLKHTTDQLQIIIYYYLPSYNLT